jgi:diguanylate cyclase (GGDEF)-like protein/PAS domain S-box-containing protein
MDDMTSMADAPSTPVSGTLPDDRFRALVEDLPAISYLADFTGAFTLRYVSPQIESVLGFSPEDWIADEEACVLALHPQDRERIVAEAEACIAAELPFDFEYRMIAADGRVLWIWEKTSIQRDAEGRPHAVNGVMLDVTELRSTQEALLHEAERRASDREKFEVALKRQAEMQRHHALHDELTGLPNRRNLYEHLNEKMETTRLADGFALLLVDLDRFKEVNDVLGHQSGDDLLCQVAERFGREVREEDLLARLGGDEFAVLVSGRNGAEAGLEIARRLSDALDREFLLSGVPVHVEASIGIARFPHDGRDATALLRCADSAMYAAKDLSTELELFDGDRDHHSPTRLKRLGELRQALTRDELVLHYQPKLRLGTGNVVGVEALVRWLHPDQGLLPPGEFVPLAEQTGLIKPLTSFVLRTSLEQLAVWRRAGHDLTIAVNVSERSLLDPEFPAEVAHVLRGTGIPSDRLELEITEGTIMADPERAAGVLRRLDALGVSLSLDDFGTGYSSLSRLRELPIDEIKIDRSFAARIEADERDVAIMRSTIELGHNLGCSVVAEGLETAEALDCVAALGCDTGQGFHIARPLDAASLTEWLAARDAA